MICAVFQFLRFAIQYSSNSRREAIRDARDLTERPRV